MGSPVDLTLGRSSSESQAVPSSNNGYHNDYLREAAQENLRVLKEERQKVEGFKRELPLCIQLLDDAIQAAEAKLVIGNGIVLPTPLRLSSNQGKESALALSPKGRGPTLEEFLPLKKRVRDEPPSDISSDRELERAEDNCRTTKSLQPSWMTETRLWNPTATRSTEIVRDERTRDPAQSEQEQSSVTNSQQQQQPTGAGAFMPFQTQQPVMPVVSRPKPRSGGFCADLNLCASATTLRAADMEAGSIEAATTAATEPSSPPALDAQISNEDENFRCGGISSSSTRKSRRCWSPELHRRFVSALHQLGGSHIATPKQLRELMKVDGLTNDEVKSHLQKYRLHTRRPSSSPLPRPSAASAPGAPQQQQLVVVGGLWMPPQPAASATAISQPGSVLDPGPQFCPPGSLPLSDYFAACINNHGAPAIPGAPPPLQMLQMHRQKLFETPRAAGTSQSQTSPQGPLQVTSQLSGATQGSSSETYESGEEEAKSKVTVSLDSLCRPRERSQAVTTTEASRSEEAQLSCRESHHGEHGNAVPPPSLQLVLLETRKEDLSAKSVV